MKITLILVGKTNKEFIKEGVEEYEKRIKKYLNFEIIYINDVKNKSKLPIDVLKKEEGTNILRIVNNYQDSYLLDDKGREFDSIGFSKFIENNIINSTKNLTFIVGGAYGFSDEVYDKIKNKISLSRLTFSHQIIRTIFVEQIYRALSIIKGEPYHHN